ncbi:MAG: hypothetical protein AAGF68_08005 [Pseudomonadota bacterium]
MAFRLFIFTEGAYMPGLVARLPRISEGLAGRHPGTRPHFDPNFERSPDVDYC